MSSFTGKGRAVISAERHILMYLFFAGQEALAYRTVTMLFDVAPNTLFNIISRVTNFLLTLAPSIIRLPNDEEKRETETYFRTNKQFPGIIGA